MVSGISGIFVAFSFSGAPLFMNIIIEDYGYSGSMILMAIIFGFGMAFIGWLFFRDKPFFVTNRKIVDCSWMGIK